MEGDIQPKLVQTVLGATPLFIWLHIQFYAFWYIQARLNDNESVLFAGGAHVTRFALCCYGGSIDNTCRIFSVP